ncbi:hypothetical protein HGRIS_007082 [Hohenbuehelia grisea]|uniref:OTU domain-containing protein n=3 Tax=Hohenbuehelia grisea TaxID=104357 RepID=A0ABR3JBI1_9AGAR
MGSAKRSQRRGGKPQAQMRTRATRSSKGRLLTDPAENTQLLTEQLRSLGLYAAPTLGDGNCLFRALTDQLYGSPTLHAQLRRDICDWIQAHKARYEPFVDDERGLDVHLQCMRQNATYGGHLELSAFAHMARRNVKVIQPGLVYVIEWTAGGSGDNPTSDQPTDDAVNDDADVDEEDEDDETAGLTERERRRMRRDKKRAPKVKSKDIQRKPSPFPNEGTDEEASSSSNNTVYVAYHDWEHFSSIRNLRGPHTGLPCVLEAPPEAAYIPPTPKKAAKASTSASAKKLPKIKLKVSAAAPDSTMSAPPVLADASQVPLPPSPSRTPTPTPSLSVSSPSPPPSHVVDDFSAPPASSDACSAAQAPISPPRNAASALSHTAAYSLRVHRSPKRSFDESSAGSGSGSEPGPESVARRTRSRLAHSATSPSPSSSAPVSRSASTTRAASRAAAAATKASTAATTAASAQSPLSDAMLVDDDDPDADTPGLSAPGSQSSASSSLSSLSSSPDSSAASSPMPPPPEPEESARRRGKATRGRGGAAAVSDRPLTRRQRKALGLPKPRAALGASGAGRIVIPGGRYRQRAGDDDGEGEAREDEEWRRNGTGRVDVRGFRELKI